MLTPDSGRTMPGVWRGAAIADDGVVLTGELEHDLASHDAGATDAASASGSAQAEVFFEAAPRYDGLSGRVSFADADGFAC
jgi:N-methylhydantoinase B